MCRTQLGNLGSPRFQAPRVPSPGPYITARATEGRINYTALGDLIDLMAMHNHIHNIQASEHNNQESQLYTQTETNTHTLPFEYIDNTRVPAGREPRHWNICNRNFIKNKL